MHLVEQRAADSTDSTITAPGYVRIHGFTVRAGVLRLRDRAAELGLCEKTLRRAIYAGELGMVRIGDLIFISEQHIADWLLANERRAVRKAA